MSSRKSSRTEKLPRETFSQRVEREIRTFGLMPWELAPSMVSLEGPPPDWASQADRESWPRAQELRREILEKYGDEYFNYLPDDV